MPKTKVVQRKPVRLPVLMLQKINELVEAFPELHYNRQSFIESAVREKMEKFLLILSRRGEAGREETRPSHE